jgi:hypothetical protein
MGAAGLVLDAVPLGALLVGLEHVNQKCLSLAFDWIGVPGPGFAFAPLALSVGGLLARKGGGGLGSNLFGLALRLEPFCPLDMG